jgi:GT2 family glycosyltransferase
MLGANVLTEQEVQRDRRHQSNGMTPAREALTDPALTICIPTYERPHLVERSIRSAIAASLAWSDRVELIVTDNSPSVTSARCKTALAQWPGRALYLGNQTNIGMVANANQGIAHATGRYVLVLHDDDYLLPAATSAILDGIRTAGDQDAALLFGVKVVDADGHTQQHRFFKRERYLSPQRALMWLLSDPSFVRIPAIVVRRSIYETVGNFDDTVGKSDDLDMWLRIFSRYGVRCLPTTVSAYTVHEAAETTGMFTAETAKALLQIFDRAAAMGVLPAPVVRRCEADWFHKFILAGASRRLGVGDRRGAHEVLALFRMPEIQTLGWSRRWLSIRLAMHLLVTMPAKISRGVARWAQYHGSWLTAFGRKLA